MHIVIFNSRSNHLVHPIRHITLATLEARLLRNAKLVSLSQGYGTGLDLSSTSQPGVDAAEQPLQDLEQSLNLVRPGDRVIFFGGDETLSEQLPGLVARAKRAGAKQIIVQTSETTLAYDGHVRALRTAGVDVFAVGLHGAIAPMHDWVTQDSGSFMQSVRGIQNVRKMGGTVLVNSVMVRSNFRHVADLVSLSGRLGAKAVRLLWPYEEGVAEEDVLSVTPHPDVVKPYILAAESQATRIGLRLHVELPTVDERQGQIFSAEMA